MSEGDLTIYWASVSSDQTRKKNQQHIERTLTSLKIDFTIVDVTKESGMLKKMRELSGNPVATPPQLFKGDKYLGDYESFFDAVEDKRLPAFLDG